MCTGQLILTGLLRGVDGGGMQSPEKGGGRLFAFKMGYSLCLGKKFKITMSNWSVCYCEVLNKCI